MNATAFTLSPGAIRPSSSTFTPSTTNNSPPNTTTAPPPTVCTRRPARMAILSRRGAAKVIVDVDAEAAASASVAVAAADSSSAEPVHVAEVAAISATVCDFMNTEHVRDIANYVVRFGNKFNDLSQLTQVKMTGLDAAGFTTDIVSCDETSHCVCVQERFDWPLGLCMNSHDVINALKHLSLACGLPADF